MVVKEKSFMECRPGCGRGRVKGDVFRRCRIRSLSRPWLRSELRDSPHGGQGKVLHGVQAGPGIQATRGDHAQPAATARCAPAVLRAPGECSVCNAFWQSWAL